MVIVLGMLALASCGESENGNDPNVDDGGEYIYSSNSDLTVIVGEGVSGEEAYGLADAIGEVRGTVVKVNDDSAAPAEHEIILGKTNRELTDSALTRLNREIEDYSSEDESSYVIYSDGKSIAVVFDDDYDAVAKTLALEYVMDNYVKTALKVNSGAAKTETFDLVDDYYAPLDEAHKNEILDEAREKLGDETVQALINMTMIYDYRLVEWLANLYDPCICVCKGMGEEVCQDTIYCRAQGGGFYFSNSARDNVGYLPDVETTRQALDFIDLAGMTWMYGGNYENGSLPDEILKAIGRYTQALQCEDGYFRHPQWSHLADNNMRLNRDLNWATTLLGAAGLSFVYDTTTGHKGSGLPSWANESIITSSINGRSSIAAVSKVIAVDASSPDELLESVETWRAFLESYDSTIRKSSYGNGSAISTYSAQIQARDRVIGTLDDPTPLMDATIEWFNSHMNPERGTWVWDEANGGNSEQMGRFAETNGVMKISGLYGAAQISWPHGIEAMQICVEVLENDEYPTGSVDIYNAWIALKAVYNCMVSYGTEEEKADAEEFMQNFRENATDAIGNSALKMSYFKRPDGSFSYPPALNSEGKFQGGNGYSMGMPTQIAGTDEGDVNGAIIASVDTWGHVCSALGITRIPIFGAVEMHEFRKIIMSSSPVFKEGSSMNYTVVDFEDEEVGEEPAIGLTVTNRTEGSSTTVRYDAEKDNNYLELVTKKGSSAGDSIYITCESQSLAAKSWVFEGDLCVTSVNSQHAFQIHLGNAHMIIIKNVNGKIRLVEASSDSTAHALNMDLGVELDFGDWFRLKVEYFVGDHNTARFKIYFDDLSDGEDELQLLAVTDNYFSQYGDKFNPGGGKPSTNFKSVHIYSYSDAVGELLLDNLAAYRTKNEYVAETDSNNQPLVYNIDPPDSPEKKYEFKSEALPEDFKVVNGAPAVSSGALALGNSAELRIPINVRTAGSKCATAAFDINCTSANTGSDILTLTFTEALGDIITLKFRIVEIEGVQYITAVQKAESEGAVISDVRIPLGKSSRVTVDYHHDQDVALVFVDGEFVGASSMIYKNANRRTAAELVLVTSSDAGSYTVDNLIFEKNKNDYDEATKPNKDSIVYGFEEENSDVVLAGGAIMGSASIGGSRRNIVKLSNVGQSVTVPINHRANLYSLMTLETDLYFQDANTDGQITALSVKAYDGTVAYSIALKASGNLIEVYEVGRAGVGAARIASFNKSDNIKLKLDIFAEQKIVNVYIGGKCVAKSSIFISPELITTRLTSFEIASSGVKSVLCVDNVKAETLYQLYEAVDAKTEANTDSTEPLDFEKSSTGSLPDNMIANGVNIRVENQYNDITGEYSNVGILDTIRGKNETIGIKLDKANTQSCVTFETDVKFSNNEYDHLAQVFFVDGSASAKNAYGVIFSKSGGGFKITNYCDGDSVTGRSLLVDNLKLDTWYRIKIEYFLVGDGSAIVRISLDGNVIAVTDSYFNKGSSSAISTIQKVQFYTFLDGKCSIIVDNMSVTTSDAVCNDAVTVK